MKTRILFTLILIAGLVLAGLGIYDYQHRPTSESLQTALIAQKTLTVEVKDLQLHDAVDLSNANTEKTTINVLQGQKTTLCSYITSRKLINPVCQ